jgi:orotate phosphoribosyltransferase
VSQDLLTLATAREGHFRLESGHHGRRWLDLDGLFTEPARIGPFVDALATTLREHQPEAVCGPLLGGAFLAQMLAARLACEFLFTERVPSAEAEGFYGARYCLPRGLRDRARGRRIAIVDDAISAGSSVRATYDELRALGGRPVVVGALLSLGSAALPFFEPLGIPIESVTRMPYEMWAPAECPLCASGQLLEEPWSNARNEGEKP